MANGAARSFIIPDRTSTFGGRLRDVTRLVAEQSAIAEATIAPPNRFTKHGTRLTTRRLATLIAVIAMLLGAQRLKQRQAYCLMRAAYHADMEVFHGGGFPQNMDPTEANLYQAVMPLSPASIPYHQRMKREWERAATRPWSSIDPDRSEAR